MKSLHCSFLGHKFEVSKKVTHHVNEYQCKHCNTQVTTNGKGSLSELTPKYKEINFVLKRIHNNRILRKQQEHIILNH